MTDIGKNIKQIRKIRGLTQKELSDKLGYTQQAVSEWENNGKIPDTPALQRIAEALDIPLDIFFYDYSDKSYSRLGVDITDDIKKDITEAETRLKNNDYKHPDNTNEGIMERFTDRITISSNKAMLRGRKCGRYIVWISVNEFEYHLYKTIKRLNPFYRISDFIKSVNSLHSTIPHLS